jgi:hypothetical protein
MSAYRGTAGRRSDNLNGELAFECFSSAQIGEWRELKQMMSGLIVEPVL